MKAGLNTLVTVEPTLVGWFLLLELRDIQGCFPQGLLLSFVVSANCPFYIDRQGTLETRVLDPALEA